MPTGKGKKVGPRITVEWGSVTKKVNGQKKNVKVTSRVVATTATLFGLTESKAAAAKVVNTKTKKGTRKVLQSPSTGVARRVIMATVDGKIYHRVPVPQGISLAKAFAIFQKGKKAYAIKFQGGIPKIIGKASKDSKTKSKAAVDPTKK
jgi:hypothetical protein